MPNQTLDVNKFFDSNQILSQIKQLKEVNDLQNTSIARVSNSFNGLDSSVKVLNNSTDLLIKLLEYDASERENREKENLRSLKREKQQRVLESKTTISQEPSAPPTKSSTQTSFAAAVAGALGAAALADNQDTSGDNSNLTSGSVPGGNFNMEQLVSLAKKAGFSDSEVPIMASIAAAESSGNSSSLNDNPRTGDLSYGLWQINMIGDLGPERRKALGIKSNEDLFDPATNARAAKYIKNSQGFGAWSVYSNGSYKSYLNNAKQSFEKIKKQKSQTSSTQASATTPASSKTSVASATTSSSSLDSQIIGETSKTDAPEYDASQLGVQSEPMTPMVSPTKPTSTIPSLMPIDTKISSATIQEPTMDYMQTNPANYISPSPLGSVNDVIDKSNIDRRQFINSWGIVA